MPSAADVARCPRCFARIVWTLTARNVRMAINADPDPSGNQAIRTDVAGTLRSRGISRDRDQLEGGEWLGMPHAATCTNPAARRLAGRTPQAVRRPSQWRPR